MFRKIVSVLNKIQDKIEMIANIICVFCLTMQTALICIMVAGRYFFKKVPPGTEELALLAMVWMALLSITLSIRDDSHLKMELVDLFVSERGIKFFQIFSGIATGVFGVYMVNYGLPLWKLRWGTRMSTIHMSNAWYYAVIPLTGVLMVFAASVFVLNSILAIIDEKQRLKENPGTVKERRSNLEAKAAAEISAAEAGKESNT